MPGKELVVPVAVGDSSTPHRPEKGPPGPWAASLPFWRKWCLKAGLMDEPGERKIHAEPIPLAGGFAVLTGIMVPTLGAALLLWVLSGSPAAGPLRQWMPPGFLDEGSVMLLIHGLGVRGIQLAGILSGAVGMAIVGWLDDKHELRPAAKFAGQLLIAGLVAASGVRITLFVHNAIFSYAIT